MIMTIVSLTLLFVSVTVQNRVAAACFAFCAGWVMCELVIHG